MIASLSRLCGPQADGPKSLYCYHSGVNNALDSLGLEAAPLLIGVRQLGEGISELAPGDDGPNCVS